MSCYNPDPECSCNQCGGKKSMESERDQCVKEGCRGCSACGGRYSDNRIYGTQASVDLRSIPMETLLKEVQLRRSKERIEIANKKINQKIAEKEKYIKEMQEEVKTLKNALLRYEG